MRRATNGSTRRMLQLRESGRRRTHRRRPLEPFPGSRSDHSYLTSSFCELAHLVVTPPPDARTRKYSSAQLSLDVSEFATLLCATVALKPKVLGPMLRFAGPN